MAAAGIGGLKCASLAWKMLQGGNTWAGWCSWIAFGRDHVGLEEKDVISAEQYAKYSHWETLAKLSGYRFMHEEFCIISDRPLEYHVRDDGQPHCETGPFVRWSDGSAFYALNGIYVSQQIIDAPHTLTKEQVRNEPNAEVRRHMLDRYAGKRGSEAAAAWIMDMGLQPISTEDITHKMQPSGLSIWRLSHGDAPVLCKLFRANLNDDEPLNLLWVVCTSTAKEVFLRVPHIFKDARAARAWTFDGVSVEDMDMAVET
jgi:hypothetical protein